MNKKIYLKPATSVIPVKIESLLTVKSQPDDPDLARESGDFDFEEFEEEEKAGK